jgi:diphthamide biosynthesis methyltransferase
MAATLRNLFGGGRQRAQSSNDENAEGPEPRDIVVTGTPVVTGTHVDLDGEALPSQLAENFEAAEAAEAAVVAQGGSALEAEEALQVTAVAQRAHDQRVDIAQTLGRNLRNFQHNICLLNGDQIQRLTLDINTAPLWMQETYDTQVNFTWALAGFNVLLSSFFPGGKKTAQGMDQVCASP